MPVNRHLGARALLFEGLSSRDLDRIRERALKNEISPVSAKADHLKSTPMSPRESASQLGGAADAAAKTGRSALLLTGAKFWFLVSGFIIQWALQRVLRDAAGIDEGKRLYGLYSTATGFAAILNAFVYQGTTQAVATFTGRDPANAASVKAAAFRLQAILGGGLFALWWLAAPWLATTFYDNPNLAGPLRLGSLILLGYAFYAVVMGSLTGRSLFTRQAIVDVSYSTLKVLAIPGAAYLVGETLSQSTGSNVGYAQAAVGGFAAAGWSVLALGLFLTPRTPTATQQTPVIKLFAFQAMTMLLSGLVTWVTQADLQLLNLLSDASAAAKERFSGEYRSAQLFATIPYQAVFAITFILFPLVSGMKDTDALRRTIRGTSKYALLIAAPIVGGFAGAPSRTIGLLYGEEYAAPAAAPMRILVLGYLAFSLFFVMLSIVTASGRPGRSVALVVLLALIQGLASWWLIPRHGVLGAALGSTIGMFAGWLALEWTLRDLAQAGSSFFQVIRTLIAGAGACAVTHLLLDGSLFGRTGFLTSSGAPGGLLSKLMTLVAFGAAGLVYVVLLVATNALDKEDRARFGRIMGRGKARG